MDCGSLKKPSPLDLLEAFAAVQEAIVVESRYPRQNYTPSLVFQIQFHKSRAKPTHAPKLRSSSNFNSTCLQASDSSSSFVQSLNPQATDSSSSFRFVQSLIPFIFIFKFVSSLIPFIFIFKFVQSLNPQASISLFNLPSFAQPSDLSSISQAWISTFRFIFILSSLNFNIQIHLPQLGIWNLFTGLLYVLNPKSIWYDIWMCKNRRKINLIWNLNVYELPQNRFDMKFLECFWMKLRCWQCTYCIVTLIFFWILHLILHYKYKLWNRVFLEL
jgi:hypothetical protein